MAFRLAGLGLAAAQLGMATECAEILTLLSGYWRPSLVATHNRGEIFNVDVCGGLPAMVVRMLLRTEPPPAHSDAAGQPPADLRLDLLPARPPDWRTGELVGASFGRVRVPRLWWTPERLEVSLQARVATVVELRAPEAFHDPGQIELPAGMVVDVCLVNRKTKSHAVPPPAGCP